MTAPRMMRVSDELRDARDDSRRLYGNEWLETLVLMQAQQIAELQRKVKELSHMVGP